MDPIDRKLEQRKARRAHDRELRSWTYCSGCGLRKSPPDKLCSVCEGSKPSLPGMEEMRDTLEVVWPEWFNPVKSTPFIHCKRVQAAMHPLGKELGPEKSKCQTCQHLEYKRLSKTYIKCKLSSRTSGAATDVKLMWRGCSRWEVYKPEAAALAEEGKT